MITSPAFRGRRYAVLGLARSGLASVEALVASGAHVTAWDNREEARAAVADKVEIADLMSLDLAGYDGVVVSPGVPLNRHPIGAHAAKAGAPLIGDIELFAQARATLPPHRVVGVTGTNGKSTTTALIHHIATAAGMPSTMAGNIGYPIMGQAPLAAGGLYVLELSSYQIDLTHSLDCDVAVLLNVTPDHLDRYDGVEAYAASKARLFALQSADHAAVIAIEDEPSRAIADRVTHRRFLVSSADVHDQSRWPALQRARSASRTASSPARSKPIGRCPTGWS
jgi:UDP-N-acetylmuramoylalanine--D-glutamate ligase